MGLIPGLDFRQWNRKQKLVVAGIVVLLLATSIVTYRTNQSRQVTRSSTGCSSNNSCSSKDVVETKTPPVISNRVWIFSNTALKEVTDNPAARAALANDTLYVSSFNPKYETIQERGLNIIPTQAYTSEAKLKADLSSGSLPPYIKAVRYDNEPWPFTPVKEKRNLVSYYKKASTLAHAHGLLLISTPVPSRDAPLVAPYSDVIDVQAQWAQATVATYLAATESYDLASHQANPRAVILSGISTNPTPGDPTPTQLLNIAHATYPNLVRGWWLNIPTATNRPCSSCNVSRPDIGIAFLSALGPAAQ